jgi:uncharacterized repeat protein (TIGR01451 family)
MRINPGILAGTLAVLALVAGAALFATRGAEADTSGPNASGYVWIDSNSPAPQTTFEWVDATGGTQPPNATDSDDDYDTVALPFTFNFFGVDYTQADISSNGFLSFTTGSDCNDNYNWDDTLTPGIDAGNPIPHTDVGCEDASGWGANPLIAAWFDDIDPGECGEVYYDTVGTAPNQQFVVQWNQVCHNDCDLCDTTEAVTFEIILFEGSNEIKVQYMDTVFTTDVEAGKDITEENHGNTATSGIDKDATVGLGYHWAGEDTDALTDNLAVLYTTGAVDLAITKTTTATSVKVGDQVTYDITVTNNGPGAASAVTVTDDLPDLTSYVSATPSQGTCAEAAGVVTCNLGDIAAAGTATIQLKVAVTGEGTISNSAVVAAETSDFASTNNTAVANVTSAPGATVAPTASPSPTPAGLPNTGGQPGSGAGAPWLVLAVAAVAVACGLAGAAAARRAR